MKNSKIVGVIFSIVAILTVGIFVSNTEFSIQPQSYFSLAYCLKFVSVIISTLLLISGVALFTNRSNTNFLLTLFGYAALGETLFSWIGLAPSSLTTYSAILFFCCAIVALWIAHSNVFKFEKISYGKLIASIAFGAIESLLPNFL
jgi:hypothetical protein